MTKSNQQVSIHHFPESWSSFLFRVLERVGCPPPMPTLSSSSIGFRDPCCGLFSCRVALFSCRCAAGSGVGSAAPGAPLQRRGAVIWNQRRGAVIRNRLICMNILEATATVTRLAPLSTCKSRYPIKNCALKMTTAHVHLWQGQRTRG